MNLKRAELELDGRVVVYDSGFVTNDFGDNPVLMIAVESFEDAQELLATLDRSAARKRTASKDSPPASPPSGTVPPSGPDGGARLEEKPKEEAAPAHEDLIVPGPPLSTKKKRDKFLSCGGTECHDDGQKIVHVAADPNCSKLNPRKADAP